MRKPLAVGATALVAVLSVTSREPIAVGGQGLRTAGSTSGVPRSGDGKPDLSGIWQVLTPAAWDIQDHPARTGVPAGQGVVVGNEIPYQAWSAKKRQENFADRLVADPEMKCYLPGVPRATYMPFPFEIVQTPNFITILYEYLHATRTIYMDGRKRPDGLPAFWMGDSRGRWEDDTLVIDVANFTDQTWFDRAGNFHSDALHVVERYTLTEPNTIMYEAIVEDPKVFTRPWRMRMPLYRRLEANVQLLEYECYAYLEDEYLANQRRKKK